MAWSMIVAEPIGSIVGIVCGRLGARYGRKIAEFYDLPTWTGSIAGAMLAHYPATALTKLVFNTTMVDPIGGAANLAVTSPFTALLHSIYEGLTTIIPDLDNDGSLMGFLDGIFSDTDDLAIQTPLADFAAGLTVHEDGLPHNPSQEYLPYSDPVALVSMADHQTLSTCGLETTENMAQVAGAHVGNDLSDRVIQTGGCDPSVGFPMDSYQPLLEAVGCTSLWFDADDFATIHSVVSTPGGSVGLYGDAYYLGDPIYGTGGPGQLHAITLIEPWTNPHTGQLMGIIGLDSNHQGHAMGYTFEQLREFVQYSTLRHSRYAGKALMCLPGPALLEI